MQLDPYLTFNGNCKAAFEFYARCFGGKIDMMMTHAESPMAEQAPEGWGDAIMHARMTIRGTVLMGSDSPPGYREEPKGFSISIAIDKTAEAERIYSELAEGGTVRMPLQQTFWAHRFGMVTDRFGTPWMVNCEKDG